MASHWQSYNYSHFNTNTLTRDAHTIPYFTYSLARFFQSVSQDAMRVVEPKCFLCLIALPRGLMGISCSSEISSHARLISSASTVIQMYHLECLQSSHVLSTIKIFWFAKCSGSAFFFFLNLQHRQTTGALSYCFDKRPSLSTQ